MFGEGKLSVVHPLSVSNNKKTFLTVFFHKVYYVVCQLSCQEKGLYKVVV